jgi:hypothetical protein
MGKPWRADQVQWIAQGLCVEGDGNKIAAFTGRGCPPVRCETCTARRRNVRNAKMQANACESCGKAPRIGSEKQCSRCLRLGADLAMAQQDSKRLGAYIAKLQATEDGARILERAARYEKEHRLAMARARMLIENPARVVLEAIERAQLDLLAPVKSLPPEPPPYEARHYYQYDAPKVGLL